MKLKSSCSLLALFFLVSCFNSGTSLVVRDYKEKNAEPLNADPMEFMYGDFGGISVETLNTNALPWKLLLTSLIIDGRDNKKKDYAFDKYSIQTVMKQYGFLYPKKILNWDERESLSAIKDNPVGVTTGFLDSYLGTKTPYKIEMANLNCAACHTGKTYDQFGRPKEELHLGRPNTSLNLELYTKDVFEALLYVLNKKDKSKVLDSMSELFPEMTKVEKNTYRFIWKVVQSRLNKLNEKYQHVAPYAHGGPGLSNGMGALKAKLKSKKFTAFDLEEAAFVSIPELSQKRFKTTLLADGTYMHKSRQVRFEQLDETTANDENLDQISEAVSFFLVPVMGLDPKSVPKVFPQVKRVMQYFDKYEFQKFPGTIDSVKADAGRKVFNARCTTCHGDYSQGTEPKLVMFPNKLIPYQRIGTDKYRADFDKADETLKKINSSAMGKSVTTAKTLGYVPPILNGLWASAPYFHNGSIPTLWHLMHPEARPAKFESGGHALDFMKMGIEGEAKPEGYFYKKDYTPWAISQVYDTSLPGKSNKGHEFPFKAMSEVEKDDLLEFLKQI